MNFMFCSAVLSKVDIHTHTLSHIDVKLNSACSWLEVPSL